MTKEQEAALKNLRNGSENALKGISEDRRSARMVAVSAADVVTLCGLVDELLTTPGK